MDATHGLNPENIAVLLRHACFATDPQSQQHCLRQISMLENQDGFATCIMQLMQTPDIRTEERLLAVITLKNLVIRRWTARGQVHPISPAEKDLLRSFAISKLQEADNRVAYQVSALVAKMSRADWPQDWPELLPGLLGIVQSGSGGDWLLQRRAMQCLLEVLRELCLKSAISGKATFLDALETIFCSLGPQWLSMAEHFAKQSTQLVQTAESVASSSTAAVELIAESVIFFDHFCVTTAVMRKVLEKGFANFVKMKYQSLDSHYIVVSGFVQSFYRTYQYLEGVYRQLATQQQQNSWDSGFAEDDAAGLADNDDSLEDEIYYFDSCYQLFRRNYNSTHISSNSSNSSNSEVDAPRAAQMQSLLLATKLCLGEMSSIPLYLMTKHPLEMAPLWLSIGLHSSLQILSNCYQTNQTNQPAATLANAMGINRTKVHKTVVISCILFVAYAMSCQDFLSAIEAKGRNKSKVSTFPAESIGRTAIAIRTEFFTAPVINTLLELLLSQLLSYSTAELSEWKADGEQFYKHLQNMTEKDSIKSASEVLFLNILDTFSDDVCAFLLQQLQQLQSFSFLSAGSSEQQQRQLLLRWDTVHCCAGLAASYLHHFNADEWMVHSFSRMINEIISSPIVGSAYAGACQVARFRMLWLIACWMHKFSESVVTQLVPLVVNMLSSAYQSDRTVKLMAVDALQSLIRAHCFTAMMLVPHLQQIVQYLCAFLSTELEDEETKSSVLSAVGELFIVLDGPSSSSELQQQIGAWTAQLGPFFAALWQQQLGSDGNQCSSPVCAAILEVLRTLVVVSRAQSCALHNSVLLPILSSSCAISSAIDSSHLITTAVDLWLAMMRNLPPNAYSNDLNSLFTQKMSVLLEPDVIRSEGDETRSILLLVEAYGILGGRICLTSSAGLLAALYDALLGQINPRTVPLLVRTMEAFLYSCGADFCDFLLQSGKLCLLLRACLASTEELSQSLQDYAEADISVVSYMSIVARVLLLTPNLLQQACVMLTQSSAVQGEDNALAVYASNPLALWKLLMRVFFDKFDSVGYCSAGSWRRKLWLCALLSLYPTSDNEVLNWFGEVMNIASDVLSEEGAYEGQFRAKHFIENMICMDEEVEVSYQDTYDDVENDEDGDNTAAFGLCTAGSSAVASAVADNQSTPLALREPIHASLAEYIQRDIVTTTALRPALLQVLSQLRVLFNSEQVFEQFINVSSAVGCGQLLSELLQSA